MPSITVADGQSYACTVHLNSVRLSCRHQRKGVLRMEVKETIVSDIS